MSPVHTFVLGLAVGLVLDSAFTFVQRTLYRRKLKKLIGLMPEPQECSYTVCEGDDLDALCAGSGVDIALVQALNPRGSIWEPGASWKLPRALCLYLVARGAEEKGYGAE